MASKSLQLLLALLLLVFAPRGSSAADLTQLLDNITQGKGVVSLQSTMQCMQKLLPCKPYIKATPTPSTPPPPACCDPLKDIVTSDADCLCQLSDDASLLSSLNVTKDDALKLPRACGFDADVSKCHQGSGSSSDSGSSSSSDSSSGSNSSSGAATDNDNNTGNATANEEALETLASGSTKNTTPYKMVHFGVVLAMAAFVIFPHVSI